jgi:hypothetical protein
MNITKIKNIEKDKDIFIIGGGPSILNFDLSFLSKEVVIGMNGTVMLEEFFSSKYYVISDARFIENKQKFSNIEKIIDTKSFIFREDIVKNLPKKIQKNIYTTKAIGRDGFSCNLARGFFHSSTTTMLAIQVAFYLGAKRIFLLGVDLNYYGNKARSYDVGNSEIPDAFLSYQIKNIVNSTKTLGQSSVELINLSEKSFLKPYLNFKKIQEIKEY